MKYTFQVTVTVPPGGHSEDAGDYAVALAEATSALGFCVGPFELQDITSKAQDETVDMIMDTLDGVTFRNGMGGVLVLVNDDYYIISVDEFGNTVSAYLVTVPPDKVSDTAPDEIHGWTTGWEA